MLEIVKEAEKAIAEKTSYKRRYTQPEATEIKQQEIEPLESVFSDSDSNCIVVVLRRSN